jgi:hypothetical protein
VIYEQDNDIDWPKKAVIIRIVGKFGNSGEAGEAY